MTTLKTREPASRATPITGQKAHEIQAFGHTIAMPIALAEDIRKSSADNLNQLLADTITLRDLYKKHHWQVSGPTFYQLHLLFDKHAGEQSELVDLVAERIMTLGGVSIAMAADVAETTLVPRPPKGREEAPMQISRLLHAHEIVLLEARSMARQATTAGDDGTNDLLVSNVIRTNELQAWFLAEHVVDVPLVRANDGNGGLTFAVILASRSPRSSMRRLRLVGNILAAPGAFPADAFDGGVGLQLGRRNRRAERRDGQHAAAVGDDLAVDRGGAGVKHLDVGDLARLRPGRESASRARSCRDSLRWPSRRRPLAADPSAAARTRSSRPSTVASSTSTRSLSSRIRIGWHSGSPKRTLYSSTLGP